MDKLDGINEWIEANRGDRPDAFADVLRQIQLDDSDGINPEHARWIWDAAVKWASALKEPGHD